MKNDPLVSFVVNCYNGEKYLRECLDSILMQTYKNWEIVFWDNASTDSSNDVFYAYKDSRFKYYSSKKNVFLGQARAWAVEKCRGEFIAFLDVDDKWIPEKTEIQVNEMLKDNYALSYSGIISIDENGCDLNSVIPKYNSGCIFSDLLNQFDINMPASMLNRNILIETGLNFDPTIKASEEYCLYMQLAARYKINVINKPLAKYRVYADSLTNRAISEWSRERLYTLNKIIDENPGIKNKFPIEFREAFSRATYYRARYLMSEDNKHEARKCMKGIKLNNYKYLILYLILFFPNFVWNYIHDFKTKRI